MGVNLCRTGYHRIKAFEELLRSLGIEFTANERKALQRYLEKVTDSWRRSDFTKPWYEYSFPGSMIDDHLLLAGMVEYDLEENTIALGCNSAQFFMAGAKDYKNFNFIKSQNDRSIPEYEDAFGSYLR